MKKQNTETTKSSRLTNKNTSNTCANMLYETTLNLYAATQEIGLPVS